MDLRIDESFVFSGIESKSQLTRCSFSPCGTLLLAGCESGAVVAWNSVKRESGGIIANHELGYTAACRCVDFHPSFHAIATISYQPGTGVSIWRHDRILARARSRPKVEVQPTSNSNSTSTSVPTPKVENQSTRFRTENSPRKIELDRKLAPVPDPVFATNFNRVKSQFDSALEKMIALNQTPSTVSRSLFPSSGIDKNESEINQADNKENESAAQIIKKASNSVRFNVEEQLKRRNRIDSQIRQFSPAKPEVRNEERAKLIPDESPNVTLNESSSVTHQYAPPDESLIAKTDRTRDVRREENESSKSNPETQNQNLDESSITEPITSQTEMSHPPITHLQPIQKEKKRKKRKKRPTQTLEREESTEERLPPRPEVKSQTGSLFEQMQKIALSDNDSNFV
jgi:hypothetical protein